MPEKCSGAGELWDYRFRADTVNFDGRTLWMHDPLASVVVSVDPDTGWMGKPIAAPAPRDHHAWLVHGSWLWIARRSPDELVRRDLHTGEERSSAVAVGTLASDGAGAWARTPDDEILVLPTDGSDPVPIGPAPSRARMLAAGRRLWFVDVGAVTAVDAVDARMLAHRRIPGLSWLHVTTAGVWAVALQDGRFVLHELDPSTLDIGGFQAWPPPWCVQTMLGDVAILGPAGGRLHLAWIDVRTGEELGRRDLGGGGFLEAAGDRHAFAVRVRGRGRPQELVLVGPTPGDARIVMPGEADLSGVLPLPIPVDHERVAAGVRASLSGHWSIRGVEVVDVRLEGTWPLTEVAVLLREDLRPEWLYAWTVPVWKADGRVATEDHELAWVHLMERVEACGYGLPNDPVADERGIVWL
jgi:hypothetical protein